MELQFSRFPESRHRKIPLVTTTFITQLLEAFDANKVEYEPNLKTFNLTEKILSTSGHLPANHFLSFVQSVIENPETLDFGFDQPIHSAPEQLLRLGTKPRPSTLLSLIHSIAQTYEIHTDLIRMKNWHEPDGSLWLGMHQHPSIRMDLMLPYLSIHLFSLIQIIRYAEAEDWLPKEIFLPIEKRDLIFMPFWLRYCRVRYQENLIGVKMNPSSLGERPERFLQGISNSNQIGSTEGLTPPRQKTDAVQSIKSILRTYLKATHSAPSYHMMAEVNGFSDRSLSRKLYLEGENYRSLVCKVRIELSMEYLRESNAKIETIANWLGYPRCSSFVRSFKRITGRSPTEFRQKNTPRKIMSGF